MKLILSLLAILFIVDTCSGQSQNDCVFSDWKESFSKEGWSYCNPGNYWLTGLWRLTNKAFLSHNGLCHLRFAQCCKPPVTAEWNYREVARQTVLD